MSNPTQMQVFDAIARSLRQFGYPDATSEMVGDTYEALTRGDDEMPHGIVGMFAKSQLEDLFDEGWKP